MAAQLEVARSIAASYVGRRIKVLVENKPSQKGLAAENVRSWEHGLLRNDEGVKAPASGMHSVARGEADAPDIDGRVFVQGAVSVGQFCEVKVTGHTDYDLIAGL